MMQARKIPSIIGATLLTATLAPPATAQFSPSATVQMGNAYRQQQMLNAIRQTNINQTPHGSLQDATIVPGYTVIES